MTEGTPYRHRFPMTIIGHAVWLYHRFPLSYRDVQELLHPRGIEVSHETLREWNIKFGSLFAQGLRHREPRRGSRWHLDEVCTRSARRLMASDTGFVLAKTAPRGTLLANSTFPTFRLQKFSGVLLSAAKHLPMVTL